MSELPVVSEQYAILVPSGEKRGHSSVAGPEVRRIDSPPPADMAQMSPPREKAIHLPSLDRSGSLAPVVSVRLRTSYPLTSLLISMARVRIPLPSTETVLTR